MLRFKSILEWIFVILLFTSCNTKKDSGNLYEKSLNFAVQQSSLLMKESLAAGRIPRTLEEDGSMHWTNEQFDWTDGFFPGTLWYLYEYKNDSILKYAAQQLQDKFKDHRFYTTNHDLGFVFNCSYGNAYRLTNKQDYKQVLVDAANSLITRFKPEVGCIQSWDVDKGWQSQRGWQYPVIIDNMMNLELLFEVSRITGDDKYKQVAVAHANTTLKNHFREDGSCYHVVDYDSINGIVRAKETAQGFAHESAWARGQAWGIYGYTVCFRYTKDSTYLNKAKEIVNFVFSDENMPKDLIPYWDFDAAKIPNEPRDVSAATIIASALIELSKYSDDSYLQKAETILNNLSSEDYTAKLGENGLFVLKHSVGSIPHNNEIDVPLNYADYYYVEALMRREKLKEQKK